MKIKKTKNHVIIDGCGITTIKMPKEIEGFPPIRRWLADRLGFSEYKDECIKVENFTFIFEGKLY